MDLRLATLAEEDLFLEWRAEDERNSPWWNGRPVDTYGHAVWFRARVDNPAVRLWIAEKDGEPVGDARLDSNGEVTFNTLPQHRRRGFGTQILREATRLAVEEDGWTRIRAVVDDANHASIATLHKAGYRHRPDVLFFRWPR